MTQLAQLNQLLKGFQKKALEILIANVILIAVAISFAVVILLNT